MQTAEGRVRRRRGPPPLRETNLHEVPLQTCMNLGVSEPRDPQRRRVGSQPKSSWVTFLRFQICQSNAPQGRVWHLFQCRAADPGSPRGLQKQITSPLTYRLPVSESRAFIKNKCTPTIDQALCRPRLFTYRDSLVPNRGSMPLCQ